MRFISLSFFVQKWNVVCFFPYFCNSYSKTISKTSSIPNSYAPVVRNTALGVAALAVSGTAIPAKVLAETKLSAPEALLYYNQQVDKLKSSLSAFSNHVIPAPVGLQNKGYEFSCFYMDRLYDINVMAGIPPHHASRKFPSAEEAIQNRNRGNADTEFYFILGVYGKNENRLKDILIFDLENNRWVSLNKSKGYAIAKYRKELLKEVPCQPEDILEELERQGISFGSYAPGAEEAHGPFITFTMDGVVWRNMRYSEQGGLAQDMWNAFLDGFYIQYLPHEHKARYALSKEYPLSDSMEEAKLKLVPKAREAGLEVEVVDNNLILNFCDVPNLFIRTEEGNIPAAEQPVTDDTFSHADALVLAQDVIAFANANPEKIIIFKRHSTYGTYKQGDFKSYVVAI